MTLFRALWSPPLRWVWLFILATFPLLVLFDYLAVASAGSKRFLIFQMPFMLVGLAAFGALIMLPIITFWSRRAAELMAWWLASAAFLAAVFGGMKVGHAVRMSAFHQLAQRSAPLVQAIKNYEKEHGRPPETLEQLVPQHLPAVPGTGMGAYPRYLYQHGPEVTTRYAGNPWILSVHASKGFASFDEFLYFPLQNYPETGWGGRLEPMHNWAYLHE